ncbi:glycosyltransferase family 4 protein [Nocardioides cheoyonin]|uniref:glycosyltransferase family 4 protein n=1 Tax=Nocardioides cheoyonin TaxID=3156615 RepID=UPI003CCC732B
MLQCRRALRSAFRAGHVGLIHHVTFASDWLPTPAVGVGARYIWGPVGGSTSAPRSLVRRLTLRGRIAERVRTITSTVSRVILVRRTIRGASLCIALNDDSKATLLRAGARRVVTRPNAVIEFAERDRSSTYAGVGHRDGRPTAAYVGRLVEWKGLSLAIEALARPEMADWRLIVAGSGPSAGLFSQLAQRLGCADRVDFLGHVPRSDVASILSSSDAFVFPSFHDSAPWAVAEAAAFGLPVICFPLGGGSTLAGSLARLIDLTNPVESIASHLRAVTERRDERRPTSDWTRSSLLYDLEMIYGEVQR